MIESSSHPARRGHAVLNLHSRQWKAEKIALLIGATTAGPSRRMLEIGTGSGGIAHWFGEAGPMGWEVESVDVEDVRKAVDGYRFTLVEGVELPFPDASFDVVVTNHVIEHVGDPRAQQRHLDEIRRVLKDDGLGYLAVPNRWMFVEPHFKLALLSWFPRPIADAYVRMAGKGSHYDCRPMTVPTLERALRSAGFAFQQQHGRALRATFEIENPHALLYRWLLRPLPDAFYGAIRHLFPTIIHVLRPQERVVDTPVDRPRP